jgi:hypothetical protein
MELGLVPGTPVAVINVAPLGDPLELLVRGCRLSIRHAEADAIDLDAVPTASATRATDQRSDGKLRLKVKA